MYDTMICMNEDTTNKKPVQDLKNLQGENLYKTTSAREALEMMGIDVEEALAMDEALLGQTAPNRDPSVCVCGHPSARHTVTNGVVYCKPTRMECPCRHLKPVLVAEDLRSFLRKTNGPGPMHALTRGIAASLKKGKNVTWTVEARCDRCGNDNTSVTPTPVTQSGIAVDYATGYDALLCPDCRDQV